MFDLSDPHVLTRRLAVLGGGSNRPDLERPSKPSAESRLRFEAASDARIARFADAMRQYVAAVADHLPLFVLHRVSLAARLGHGGSIRPTDRPEIERRAQSIGELGRTMTDAAAAVPDSQWLLALSWVREGTLDSPLPAVVELVGRPVAQAIAALLADYGFQPGPVPELAGPVESVVTASALNPLDTVRWPAARDVVVDAERTIGGETVMMQTRQRIDPPAATAWQQALRAARELSDADILRGSRGVTVGETVMAASATKGKMK